MSDPKASGAGSNEEIEREIRLQQAGSVSGALGMLAGAGMLKGASPVTLKQQAAVAIQEYLARRLPDAEGVLRSVLLTHVRESEVLLGALDRPIVALGEYVRQTLESDYRLEELVREADREWGRQYDERPHFETPGKDAHPDDPYTVAGVREGLQALLAGIEAGDESS